MSPTSAEQSKLRTYLIAYNIFSCIAWAYVLALTLAHLFNIDGRSDIASTPTNGTRSLLADLSLSPKTVTSSLPPLLNALYHRATTTYSRLGPSTAFVQTFAILEVVHVLVGCVKTSLSTTLMQVSSRLYAVWGVYQLHPQVRSNSYYASMVLAWSMTEVIRYLFYVFSLVGNVPHPLQWLRYTTFYLLYPIGAISEAVGNYATLPISSPWKPYDYFRALLFVIWWPSLYVLYVYMIKQRRKVLGRAKAVKSE